LQPGKVCLRRGCELWKIEKEVAEGPNGRKGVMVLSRAMIEVPSGLWVVTTRRGAAGAVAMMIV
jgi:hypothetical protein